MRRFLIDEKLVKKDKVYIKGKEAHHIKDVIRLRPGDRFIGLDCKGKVYTLMVIDAKKDILARIEKVSFEKTDFPRVLLACGIPKKNKMDYIVEKAAELGASDIIPMVTERTIVKLDSKTGAKKKSRWQKIALESSKQSGRTQPPEIHGISDLQGAINIVESLNCNNRVIPFLGENLEHISNLDFKKTENSAIFIGPEGDFTQKEIGLAKKHGFKTVSLGPLVLKVDTACFFVLSVLSSQYA